MIKYLFKSIVEGTSFWEIKIFWVDMLRELIIYKKIIIKENVIKNKNLWIKILLSDSNYSNLVNSEISD